MKLNLNQLEQHLAKQLLPCYVVSSDEPFLKQEAIDLIRQKALGTGFAERVCFYGQAPTADTLYAALNTLSLLSEKKIIELDFSEHLPGKELQNILKNYAANPSADLVVLIALAKMDSKTAKLSWITQLEKVAAIIPLWPISLAEMPQWILIRARKLKLSMSIEIANELAEYVEGNLTAAMQSLEKLALLNADKIDKTILQSIMIDESRYSIFDFVQHTIAGESKAALHVLHMLQAEGVEPILILWAIVREIRLLIELALQIEQGEQLNFLLRKYRIFFKREQAIKIFLKRFSRKDCWHHLMRAHRIDKILKGALPGNAWESLQIFCLSLV